MPRSLELPGKVVRFSFAPPSPDITMRVVEDYGDWLVGKTLSKPVRWHRFKWADVVELAVEAGPHPGPDCDCDMCQSRLP